MSDLAFTQSSHRRTRNISKVQILKCIHVNADVRIHKSEVSEEDDVLDIDVSLHYRYYHWDGGENGCDIGWIKYQIQQSNFNKDKVYIDNLKILCTIKKWRGLTI